eukprot:4648965-Pleurochrysis_carterae.AAC.2
MRTHAFARTQDNQELKRTRARGNAGTRARGNAKTRERTDGRTDGRTDARTLTLEGCIRLMMIRWGALHVLGYGCVGGREAWNGDGLA